jgi:hypothetical protein
MSIFYRIGNIYSISGIEAVKWRIRPMINAPLPNRRLQTERSVATTTSPGYPMWLASAGVKPGYSCGATDEYGIHAVEGRMHTTDLHAH